MNKFRHIQNFGLLIFILGFVIFLGSNFKGHYLLSKEQLKQATGEDIAIQLLGHSEELLNQKFSNSFAFNKALQGTIDQFNTVQEEKYRIGATEISGILDQHLSGEAFDKKIIEQAFLSIKNDVAYDKKTKLMDYTSWMEGRNYSQSELEKLLAKTADDINASIIYNYGIDNSKARSLKFSLSKIAFTGAVTQNSILWLFLTLLMPIAGVLLYNLPKLTETTGVKNNGTYHQAMKNRGWLGIITGAFLIGFYIALYWFPEHIVGWVSLLDPLSYWLKGSEASQWFFYGTLYTLAILVMGVRMIIKYRHSKYHTVRTASLMFFQTAFAFLLPEILVRLNQPYYDFKNIWPLDYSFFFDYQIDQKIEAGTFGVFMLVWGLALAAIAVPVLTYFLGKRWYCSWVCGCGGLAETLGDPYRQLSDKSLKVWHVERWMVHAVLVFAVAMTAAVLYTYFSGNSQLFGFIDTYHLRSVYGFAIGAAFAGVVGTGFYPLMGNRVWCRFGCPLAAYLGIVQRFRSRFRITTNGGQCISCGNCSTYCEMGIDVRWYAQRGQNIVRASCVGCGVCATVCPRGVLKLENTKEDGRFGQPLLIGHEKIQLLP